VTGFDSSAGMLALARRRLDVDADLHLADLGRPLPCNETDLLITERGPGSTEEISNGYTVDLG
jgi:trans-aconitate methyltransferase